MSDISYLQHDTFFDTERTVRQNFRCIEPAVADVLAPSLNAILIPTSASGFGVERKMLLSDGVALTWQSFDSDTVAIARANQPIFALKLPVGDTSRNAYFGSAFGENQASVLLETLFYAKYQAKDPLLVVEIEQSVLQSMCSPADIEALQIRCRKGVLQLDSVSMERARQAFLSMLFSSTSWERQTGRMIVEAVKELLLSAPLSEAQERRPVCIAIDRFMDALVSGQWENVRSIKHFTEEHGVAPRTFYREFVAQIGFSPRQTVQLYQLTATRKALLLADSVESIAKTARNNGLTHMGQFSTNYKKVFGERPSETVARRKKDNAALKRVRSLSR